MEVVRIPPLYGPSLEYLWHLRKDQSVLIDCDFSFKRATLSSRMHILGSNSVIPLSIPVLKHTKGSPFRDIRIDHHQKWQDQHWRSLVSCYNRSPYFEYFRSDLEPLFYAQTELLASFLLPITHWLLRQYFPQTKISDNLSDSQALTSDNGRKEMAEIVINEPEPALPSYTQVFGENFVKNLSVWDALFCIGPNFGIAKTE